MVIRTANLPLPAFVLYVTDPALRPNFPSFWVQHQIFKVTSTPQLSARSGMAKER
jgi:hypothetical protein